MGKKKVNDKIKVRFTGGSTTDVTGSCVNISYYCEDTNSRKNIICDFGIIQGAGDKYEEYKQNKYMIENNPLKDISYIFLSHSHCDHSMNLPLASSREFDGRIIMNEITKEITYKLLLDGVFIHNRDVESLQSKKHKNIECFYKESDVHIAMQKYTDTYPMNEMVKLDSNLSFRLLPNSHVVGAAMIELFIKRVSGKVEKIVYTGDVGSKLNKKFQPFLEDNATISKASMILMESTYGSKQRGFTKQEAIDERKNMIKTIKQVTKNRGKVVMPTFSFGRSQTLMTMLYEAFSKDKGFNIPIIIDSRLTNEINNTYRKVLNDEDREYWSEIMSWRNFKFIKEFKDTQLYASKKDFPCIVISSSGFLTNGHSVTWVKSTVEDRKNCIMFTGYVGNGTLGDFMTDKKHKTVKIEGLDFQKNAWIKQYKTFSSHIQQKEIIEMIKGLNNSCRIVLHHGNMAARKELKEELQLELSKMNRTNKVHIADEKNNEFIL